MNKKSKGKHIKTYFLQYLQKLLVYFLINQISCQFFVQLKHYMFKRLVLNYLYHYFNYTCLNLVDIVCSIMKSNRFLFYLSDWAVFEESLLALSVRNILVKKGQKTGWIFFNEFLFFLKFNYHIIGIHRIMTQFLDSFSLPYKLYVVRFSNRSYYFPGPIFADKEQLAFVRKAFSTAIKKQNEVKYINRFFSEIIEFLNDSPDSILLQILNHIIDRGIENRAFMHYRWILHKKTKR
jgi:hypothetical protein